VKSLLAKIRRFYRYYTALGPNQRAWVDDLRSGKFTQGYRTLQTADNKFCCLGVACKTHERVTGVSCEVDDYGRLAGSILATQPKVTEWVGLKTDIGRFSSLSSKETLVALNDDRFTFKEIANVIIDNAEQLFFGRK
jgi:hypothetical protein